jgi:hypothetical protein
MGGASFIVTLTSGMETQHNTRICGTIQDGHRGDDISCVGQFCCENGVPARYCANRQVFMHLNIQL